MAINCGLSPEDIGLLHKLLAEYAEIDEVILFGSRAMGNFKTGSDIDLAIKGQNAAKIVTTLLGRLENDIPLPYKFDLIHYESITEPALREHIDRHGISLHKI